MAALIAGAILGGITLIVPFLLDDNDAFAFLAVLLGFIVGVYFGFAVVDGRQREFWIEMAGVLLFLALSTIAFAASALLVLAAGYVGHALWDAIHRDKASILASRGGMSPPALDSMC